MTPEELTDAVFALAGGKGPLGMSGGVPAGDVAAIVSLLGDIAMWSGNQKLTEKAFALSQQIAIPTPPIEGRDADVERDAARWRALMSSDRIRMMGCAGFDTAADGTITLRDWDGWHHMGIEVWDRHPAKGDDSDSHGRKVLLAYVDARAALQVLGERG